MKMATAMPASSRSADDIESEPLLTLTQRLIPWWPLAATIAVGLLVTGLVSRTAQFIQDRQTEEALAPQADWLAQDLKLKIDNAMDPVRAVAVFVSSQDTFTDSEFDRVVDNAWGLSRSTRAIAWAPRLTGGQRQAFEDEARRSGLPEFSIMDRGPEESTVSAPQRDEYLPVRMRKALESQASPLGLDLSSDPIRSRAADRARDEGKPVATSIVQLFGSRSPTPSLQVFVPIFADGSTPVSVEERRQRLRGHVVGSFDLMTLLNQAIANTPAVFATFTVRLAEDGAPSSFPGAMHTAQSPSFEPWNQASPTASGYTTARTVDILGQKWVVSLRFPIATFDAIWSRNPYAWLLAGFLLTAVSAAFVAREKWQTALAQHLVEQRTAELEATALKMKALVDSSPLATIELDVDRRVGTWSRAAERIFGYTASEIVGQPYPLFPDRDRETFERLFRSIETDQQHVQDVPIQLRHKDGSMLDIMFSGSPLYDADRKMIGVVHVLEDVTDKKVVEQKLIQAQKMEAVGQLTGGIAHDFNNILGLVVGNLDQLIEVCEAQPDVKTLGAAALDAALRGAELVRRLMAFSRNQPLAPKLLNLAELVRGMEPVLRQALDERLVIEMHIEDDIWPVLADQAQFENAILNLAINARDAMPDGGRLGISCANETIDDSAAEMSDLVPGDYVTLTVSDTGIGIPPEVLARVFEPFFTTKEVGKGSGLGLSMVYGYALQSGGRVRIYSEVGHGTDIRLCLPRAHGTAVPDSARTASQSASTGTERILVVEDKPDVRRMAITLLTSMGYRTMAAENAAAALEILDRGERFDLLFTDLIMPGEMSGIGLAREVRRRFSKLPIVFTTGFSDPAELQREMTTLSASMIVKPYRKSALAACVRAALRQPIAS